jgi:hypothetical protein
MVDSGTSFLNYKLLLFCSISSKRSTFILPLAAYESILGGIGEAFFT